MKMINEYAIDIQGLSILIILQQRNVGNTQSIQI